MSYFFLYTYTYAYNIFNLKKIPTYINYDSLFLRPNRCLPEAGARGLIRMLQ